MNYKQFENEEAKSIVMKIALHNKSDKLLSVHVLQFIGESGNVLMYVSYANNFEIANIKTFVLISKCDFDPLKQHSNPYTLNFIYTVKQYRRNKNALYMLNYIKNKHQLTAFCFPYTSNLFRKCKYIEKGSMFGNIIFRSC